MHPYITLAQNLRRLRTADRARDGVPGEHWATFGAAIGVLGAASGIRSPLLRTLALLAGGALVLRAISGRDGAVAVVKRKAEEKGLIEAPH
jgi:hypothetical protein